MVTMVICMVCSAVLIYIILLLWCEYSNQSDQQCVSLRLVIARRMFSIPQANTLLMWWSQHGLVWGEVDTIVVCSDLFFFIVLYWPTALWFGSSHDVIVEL